VIPWTLLTALLTGLVGWLVGRADTRVVPRAPARVLEDPNTGRMRYVQPRPGDVTARARETAEAIEGIAQTLRDEVLPAVEHDSARRQLQGALGNLREESGRLRALAQDLA
jgi:hypothetical protein